MAERICGNIVLSENTGEAMRKWRRIFRLTQSEIAKRLGVSVSVISDYENSRRVPGVRFVKRFVSALIEADVERGLEVLSKYSFALESSAIIDIAEYGRSVSVGEFCEVAEARRVNEFERAINGHTIVDSIRAILEMSSFEFYRLYGLTSERALVFTAVSSGRSPMVAVRVSNLKPSAVVLHGIGAERVDRIAKKIAEVEKIPLLVTSKPIGKLVEDLRRSFA